jgi:hypothetical protein
MKLPFGEPVATLRTVRFVDFVADRVQRLFAVE